MQLYIPFRPDAVAQGRKILSVVEECGINRFNNPKVCPCRSIEKAISFGTKTLEHVQIISYNCFEIEQEIKVSIWLTNCWR